MVNTKIPKNKFKDFKEEKMNQIEYTTKKGLKVSTFIYNNGNIEKSKGYVRKLRYKIAQSE